MKLFNVITFCCAIFAGSAIADNKLPDWLSTSKKDYDLVGHSICLDLLRKQ